MQTPSNTNAPAFYMDWFRELPLPLCHLFEPAAATSIVNLLL